MIDHATGVVIGSTARLGENCTLLHNVTLGSTGKNDGDRHPKLGNKVLVGCNATILGNIKIGDGAKIGSNTIVLKPVPEGATAVGNPTRIIEKPSENQFQGKPEDRLAALEAHFKKKTTITELPNPLFSHKISNPSNVV